MNRPRVLFLNRSYWPDLGATGQLLTQLCERLVDRYEVEVACGLPARGDHRAEDLLRERVNGVRIHRVTERPPRGHSLAAKLAGQLRFLRGVRKLLRTLDPPNVVVTQTDPFLLPLLARKLQARGSRLIIYLQDLYPDVAVALTGLREGVLTRQIRGRLRNCYQAADAVVVLSEDMRRRVNDWGVALDQTHVVANWFDAEAIAPGEHALNPFREKHALGERFVVMYSGNMGRAHLLTPLLDAAARLADRTDIQFLFVGGGVQADPLRESAAARRLTNVTFLPYQPFETLGESLSAADLHLVSLRPKVHHCLYPSKLYGALAAGRPVLALCDARSSLSDDVRRGQFGRVVDCVSEDESEIGADLARAITELVDDPAGLHAMGERARRAAENEYDISRAVAEFDTVLEHVLCSVPDQPGLMQREATCVEPH